MNRVLVLVILIFVVLGCKKTKEKVEEDAAMDFVTNGQWRVSSFLKGSNDITTDFSEYRFQFKANSTVDALKNGTIEKTGSWVGNPNNRTITSNFVNASHPLPLLNGTWTLTNGSSLFIEAMQVVNGETRSMRLEKL